jgi:hypothetical protein
MWLGAVPEAVSAGPRRRSVTASPAAPVGGVADDDGVGRGVRLAQHQRVGGVRRRDEQVDRLGGVADRADVDLALVAVALQHDLARPDSRPAMRQRAVPAAALRTAPAPQLLEWMLPNTSVIGAPSMRMRVGSLIDRMASTATPSRASSTCSALPALQLRGAMSRPPMRRPRDPAGCQATARREHHRCRGSVATASFTARHGHLLERLQVHAPAAVAEVDLVGLERRWTFPGR